MTTSQIVRFSFILLLWLALCWVLVTSSPVFTFQTLFAIIASGIIVFVPLYKKYKRNGKAGNK